MPLTVSKNSVHMRIFFVVFCIPCLLYGHEPTGEIFPTICIESKLASLRKGESVLKANDFCRKIPSYPSVEDTEKISRTVYESIRVFESTLGELAFSTVIDEQGEPIRIEWLRKDKTELLLFLMKTMSAILDKDFDPQVPVAMNIIPVPDVSDDSGQIFVPGMCPDDIKNSKTRDAYRKACWENTKNILNKQIHADIKRLIPKTGQVFQEHVLEAYRDVPDADQELMDLLEKYAYPEVERIKLLANLNIPYKGFRCWQSTDGLFQTTAKFVTLDKGEVILEKTDGKQTTIDLSALRKEDQDYVKTQSQPEDVPGKNTGR